MKYFLIGIIFILYGCNAAGMWKDANIPIEIIQEVSEVRNALFETIKHKDSRKFKKLVSEVFLNTTKIDLNAMLESLDAALPLDDFQIENEFYSISLQNERPINVMTGATGDHDYKIVYKAMNRKSYVIFGSFSGKLEDGSITLIFSKYDTEWKIDFIGTGLYKILNKDAFDLYTEAKILYNQKYLIDAVLYMSMSIQCQKPSGNNWQYIKESEMNDFRDKLLKEYTDNYKFPITLNDIETKPQIKSIVPQKLNEGYFPMIIYATNISMQDTSLLSVECDEIHSRLETVLPGLAKNKKYIFYRAKEKSKFGSNFINHYGLVRNYE